MRETRNPSRPGFVVDPNSVGSTQGRQIAWEFIPEKYRRGAALVKLNGAAVATDVSLTVDALLVEVPAGRQLNFGGGKLAVTTATAPVGATTIPVAALAAGIADNAEAYFQPTGQESAGKVIPAGKVMCEMTDRRLCTRAERPNAETASQLLKTNATEDSISDAKTGYGTYDEGRFFENLLPDADPTTGLISSTYKTELRAAGGAWRFEQYRDSRGD
jgi:hypothetical protein